jgi:hypothetical protein
MRVYHESHLPLHTLIVCPGAEFKNVSDWKDAAGKPATFTVEFKYGVADVTDQLGKYLLDKGLAKRSQIILPASQTGLVNGVAPRKPPTLITAEQMPIRNPEPAHA